MTTNNQANEQPAGERKELIRNFRQLLGDACEHAYQGSSEAADKLIDIAVVKYAARLEADAQRQPWASKEHFDAAWEAFGATSFEDLHQKLSIHDIKRLFAMFAEVAQRPAMKPLTDIQIQAALPSGIVDRLLDPWDCGMLDGDTSRSVKRDILNIARAIEAAHGIK